MRLAEYMARMELTDKEVAAAIGCERASVTRYRNGNMRPKLEKVVKITEFTGGQVTADDWITHQ
jgi:transcriptional regulator with XRE-family HTH domain